MKHYTPGAPIARDDYDLMLYLLGEETLKARGRMLLNWVRLAGSFHGAMDRHWHDIPTAMILFGYPYKLYNAPHMPCYVNANATMPSMQQAVVDCLLARRLWNSHSPVDAFCGLEDVQY